MGAFDAGSGLNSAGLHTVMIVLILMVSLGWLGWVLVRTTKLTTKGRISEGAMFMAVVQAMSLMAVLSTLIFLM